MALSLPFLKYSGAAAPHSRATVRDWLGIPVANDSCRVILVMAAKRQKLRENIIEFSLFTVATYVCPNKEGTSRMQNRNTLGLFPFPKLCFAARRRWKKQMALKMHEYFNSILGLRNYI